MTSRLRGATIVAAALLALPLTARAACAPSATSIFPTSATPGSDLFATVAGEALSGATATVVGDAGVAATVQSSSGVDAQVHIVIDASAVVGERILVLDTPGGSAAVSFTVIPPGGPVIDGTNPPLVGFVGQPLVLTLTGSGLGGVSASTVAISGGKVLVPSAMPSADGTQLALGLSVWPDAEIGTRALTIGNGVASVVLTLYVKRPPPQVTLASPAAGEIGTTVPLSITGTNLTGAALVITGPDVALTDVATPNDATLTATLAIAPTATPSSEARLLIVTTESGQTTTEFFIVAPNVPTITSNLPGAGEPGQPAFLTLHGLNFTGATVSESDPDLSLGSVNIVSDETINVQVIVAGGAATNTNHTITVTNGSGFATATFRIIPPGTPFIGDARPPFGNRGALVFLVVDGINLTGTSSITLSGPKIMESNIIWLDMSAGVYLQIDPTASVGFRDITIVTPGGSYTRTAGFRVNVPGTLPSITDVSPTLVEPGATTHMTVMGSNFAGGSVLVTGPEATVANVVVDTSGTTITFDLTLAADAPAETRAVIVVTENGTARCNIATDPAPPPFTPAKLVKSGALFTVDSTAFRLFVFEFSIDDQFVTGLRTVAIPDGDGSLTLADRDVVAIERAFRELHRGWVRARAVTATNRIAVSTAAVIRR